MRLNLIVPALLLSFLQFSFAQDKPNLLFIAIDDLNDYLSCMNGAVSVPTPNIDRLTLNGSLFTNAHCQAPICGPSRASVMTGPYSSTSGNYLQVKDAEIKEGNKVVGESIFIPAYFEQHGYKTMAVGKIYHGGDAAQTFHEYGGYFNIDGLRPAERMNYDPKKLPNKTGNTYADWGAYPAHDSIMGDYKHALWKRDTRTVLIFKDAGKNRKRSCNAPVGLIDIYPTLLDMCGLPKLKQLEGNSLAGLVHKPKMEWNHPALCMFGENNVVVRGRRFRLTQYEDNSLELYDMKKDPNEWYNLASDPNYRKAIEQLQKHSPKAWALNSEYLHYNINSYLQEKTIKRTNKKDR